jgi:hypothetical protein
MPGEEDVDDAEELAGDRDFDSLQVDYDPQHVAATAGV